MYGIFVSLIKVWRVRLQRGQLPPPQEGGLAPGQGAGLRGLPTGPPQACGQDLRPRAHTGPWLCSATPRPAPGIPDSSGPAPSSVPSIPSRGMEGAGDSTTTPLGERNSQ